MNADLLSVSPGMINMLGSALVNFIWQGAVVGISTAGLLRLLRNGSPGARYTVAMTGLLACFAAPLFDLLNGVAAGVTGAAAVDPSGQVQLSVMSDLNLFRLLQWWPWMQDHMVGIVTVWAVAVLLLSFRMVMGLAWIWRATGLTQSRSNPLWQARLDRLAVCAGIKRPVVLRESDAMASPAVAGWWRPVVLLPAALMSGMPPDLLEALLAHEVAHIKRMDYMLNLAQSVVEILLFYHPAVWWISRQVRIEREQIADDLAASWTGDPHRLAVALSQLEQFQFANAQLCLSASGGDLVGRIRRLTVKGRRSTGSALLISLISCLCAGASVVLIANAAPEQTTPTEPAAPHSILNFASCAKPAYPKDAFASAWEGTVHMAFSSDTTGRVTDAKVLKSSGHVELDNAALNTLKLCSFKPAVVDGKPVKSTQSVDYVWKLHG